MKVSDLQMREGIIVLTYVRVKVFPGLNFPSIIFFSGLERNPLKLRLTLPNSSGDFVFFSLSREIDSAVTFTADVS